MRLLFLISGAMIGWSLAIMVESVSGSCEEVRPLQAIPSAWSPPGCGAEDLKRGGREFVRFTCELPPEETP